MDISGRVAIITGASSGIGRAVAEVMAEAGAAGIVIADIDLARAEETREQIEATTSAQGLAVETDVGDEDQINGMVEAAMSRFGRVDILVNSAGICPIVPWDNTTLESWNRILQINLTGSYLCSKAVLPHMRQRNFGRLVFISSVAAFMGSVIGHVAYGASKAGVIALMKVIAKEFVGEGILANAIAPGSVDTPLTDGFGAEVKQQFAEGSPLKRQATAREIADAALFLVSDRSTYVNGATLHLNAGMLLV